MENEVRQLEMNLTQANMKNDKTILDPKMLKAMEAAGMLIHNIVREDPIKIDELRKIKFNKEVENLNNYIKHAEKGTSRVNDIKKELMLNESLFEQNIVEPINVEKKASNVASRSGSVPMELDEEKGNDQGNQNDNASNNNGNSNENESNDDEDYNGNEDSDADDGDSIMMESNNNIDNKDKIQKTGSALLNKNNSANKPAIDNINNERNSGAFESQLNENNRTEGVDEIDLEDILPKLKPLFFQYTTEATISQFMQLTREDIENIEKSIPEGRV